jgi:hypothetical protein
MANTMTAPSMRKSTSELFCRFVTVDIASIRLPPLVIDSDSSVRR